LTNLYGDCNLGFSGEIGAVVPYLDGFIVAYSAPNGTQSNPYNTSVQYDSKLMRVVRNAGVFTALPSSFVLSGADNEIVTLLAPYNTPWSNDTFLIGAIRENCITGPCLREFLLSTIGGSEILQLTPVEHILRPDAFFGERTIFSSGSNGDVAWVRFANSVRLGLIC